MICEAIADYIKQQGIKQSVLSKKTGLTPQSINSALKEKRKLSIEEYEKICESLNVPINFFFDLAKQKNNPPV